MSTSLDFWDIQRPSVGVDYPKDMDFYLTEAAYWDLELTGEIWDDFCEPEAVQFNQKFTTNGGQLLVLTNWRAPRWLPGPGGVIPQGFIAKNYKVIIYTDAVRSNVLKTITGGININADYLIDKQGWFVSKIISSTPSSNIGIYQSVDIFCNILQPPSCRLIITIQKDQNPPSTLYDEYIGDPVKEKLITFSYTFNQWGIYTLKFHLITYAGNYMQGWCKTNENYVEERQSIIKVGSS